MGFFRHLLVGSVLFLLAYSLLAQSSDPAEQSHHAKELMDAGKFDEAIPIYRDLVRGVPNNPGLITDLGLALHMGGREQEAVIEFQKALKLDPGSVPAKLYLGYAYLSLGETDKAIAPLEKAVSALPQDLDARESLAEVYLASERFDRAAEQFSKITEADGERSKAWYGLGRSYEGLSQRAFEELGKAAPGSAYWLTLVADARLKINQYDSAFYLYRQALAKMPDLPGAHAAVADLYKKTGHADWAKTEAERESGLKAPDCGSHRIECDFAAGRYQDVAAAAARTPEALFWKSRADNKLAIEAFSHLGGLPSSPEMHELMAEIHGEQRQYLQSAEEWRKAYELSGHRAEIGQHLAIALMQADDKQAAGHLLQDLLNQQPDSAQVNYLLGNVLVDSQQPAKALPYLEKAVRRDPRLLAAQSALARALLQTGQSEKAIPHLKAALPIDQNGSLHYQLARAYQSTGQTQLADQLLKEYHQIQQSNQHEATAEQQEIRITPPDP